MKIIKSQSAAVSRILSVYTRNVKSVATRVLLEHGFIGILPCDNAPNTFDELKQFWASRKADDTLQMFPVFNGGNDNTIFDDANVNMLARAWHDIGHIILDAPFTVEGERMVAEWQCLQLHGIDKEILMCDVVAQTQYYADTGEFVANQKDFVISKLFA